MTHTKFHTYPAPKSLVDKTNVQKTWRAAGWKPGKKQPARGVSQVYSQEGRTT